MSALSPVLRLAHGPRLLFWCPGCDKAHGVTTGPGGWEWDGDALNPTFSPSVLVTNGHYMPGHEGDCWCTFNAARPGEEPSFTCGLCHSFVRAGQIQFLPDSTHALAGQTVPLPAWEP